jgi:hypothetical protein
MDKNRPAFVIGGLILSVVVICLVMVKVIAPSKSDFKDFSSNITTSFVLAQQDIIDLQNDAQTQSDKVAELNSAVSSLPKIVQDNVNALLKDIQDQINSVSQKIDIINQTLANDNTRINNLVNDLNGKLSTSSLNEIKNLFNTYSSTINSLQASVNSIQSTVAALTDEIRGSNSTQGKVKLIGANDLSVIVTSNLDTLYLARFQCTQTGALTLIRLRATTYGGVKVAIYSDNASKPNVLLSSNTYDNILADGYSTVTIPSVNLVSGQYYWLAYDSATLCIGWASSTTGLIWFKALPYAGLVFPAVINDATGYGVDARLSLISGWTGY